MSTPRTTALANSFKWKREHLDILFKLSETLETELAAAKADAESWRVQADENARLAVEAGRERDAIKHHMESCRAIAGVPDDETLAVWIGELKAAADGLAWALAEYERLPQIEKPMKEDNQ